MVHRACLYGLLGVLVFYLLAEYLAPAKAFLFMLACLTTGQAMLGGSRRMAEEQEEELWLARAALEAARERLRQERAEGDATLAAIAKGGAGDVFMVIMAIALLLLLVVFVRTI